MSLACQDFCINSSENAVKEVTSIVRGLMNKDEKLPGTSRLDWLSNEDAVDFVAAITSVGSVKELRKVVQSKSNFNATGAYTVQHHFLASHGRRNDAWDKGALMPLIALANVQAYPRRYHYQG
jgi:hypothetical protein